MTKRRLHYEVPVNSTDIRFNGPQVWMTAAETERLSPHGLFLMQSDGMSAAISYHYYICYSISILNRCTGNKYGVSLQEILIIIPGKRQRRVHLELTFNIMSGCDYCMVCLSVWETMGTKLRSAEDKGGVCHTSLFSHHSASNNEAASSDNDALSSPLYWWMIVQLIKYL